MKKHTYFTCVGSLVFPIMHPDPSHLPVLPASTLCPGNLYLKTKENPKENPENE